jgi:hypothetical protein
VPSNEYKKFKLIFIRNSKMETKQCPDRVRTIQEIFEGAKSNPKKCQDIIDNLENLTNEEKLKLLEDNPIWIVRIFNNGTISKEELLHYRLAKQAEPNQRIKNGVWVVECVNILQSGGDCYAYSGAVVNQIGGYCNAFSGAVVNQSRGDCGAYSGAVVNQSGGHCNAFSGAVVNQSGGDCHAHSGAVVNQNGGDCYAYPGSVVNHNSGYCDAYSDSVYKYNHWRKIPNETTNFKE